MLFGQEQMWKNAHYNDKSTGTHEAKEAVKKKLPMNLVWYPARIRSAKAIQSLQKKQVRESFSTLQFVVVTAFLFMPCWTTDDRILFSTNSTFIAQQGPHFPLWVFAIMPFSNSLECR